MAPLFIPSSGVSPECTRNNITARRDEYQLYHQFPSTAVVLSTRFSLFLLLLAFTAFSSSMIIRPAHGFAPVQIHSSSISSSSSTTTTTTATDDSFFALSAKKVQGMKKTNKKAAGSSASAAGGAGAGFGASVTSSRSTSKQQQGKSKSQSLQGKVRTVSGFSGSGTKPLRQAANTFDAIRKEYGKEACWDLYCKSPLDDPHRLWYVGKIAVTPNTAATPPQAVLAQKRIILEYSKRELRPQNLGLPRYADTLELWLAPGDTEMDCVQNKVSLEKVQGSMADLVDDFSVADVGYNPEIYIGDEREKGGLRITRDENGDPIKAVFEVNESA